MIISNTKCRICGQVTDFSIGENATLYRDAICEKCGATIRTSDLADVF